jgi:hypothetical protein
MNQWAKGTADNNTRRVFTGRGRRFVAFEMVVAFWFPEAFSAINKIAFHRKNAVCQRYLGSNAIRCIGLPLLPPLRLTIARIYSWSIPLAKKVAMIETGLEKPQDTRGLNIERWQ